METVRYAKALIAVHGKNAAKFANSRADKYAEAGDPAEELVWRNIAAAIESLLADDDI